MLSTDNPFVRQLADAKTKVSTRFFNANVGCGRHEHGGVRCRACVDAGIRSQDLTERNRRIDEFTHRWPLKKTVIPRADFHVNQLQARFQAVRRLGCELSQMAVGEVSSVQANYDGFLTADLLIELLQLVGMELHSANKLVEGFLTLFDPFQLRVVNFDEFVACYTRMKIFSVLRSLQSLQAPPLYQIEDGLLTSEGVSTHRLARPASASHVSLSSLQSHLRSSRTVFDPVVRGDGIGSTVGMGRGAAGVAFSQMVRYLVPQLGTVTARKEAKECFAFMLGTSAEPANFVSWTEIFVWYLNKEAADKANRVYRKKMWALLLDSRTHMNSHHHNNSSNLLTTPMNATSSGYLTTVDNRNPYTLSDNYSSTTSLFNAMQSPSHNSNSTSSNSRTGGKYSRPQSAALRPSLRSYSQKSLGLDVPSARSHSASHTPKTKSSTFTFNADPMLSARSSAAAIGEFLPANSPTSRRQQNSQLVEQRLIKRLVTQRPLTASTFVKRPQDSLNSIPVVQLSQHGGPKCEITRAVLICVEYEGLRLGQAKRDLQTTKQALSNLGFDVNDPKRCMVLEEGTDLPPTTRNVKLSIEWLVRDTQPEDVLWFYYSGLGGHAEIPGLMAPDTVAEAAAQPESKKSNVKALRVSSDSKRKSKKEQDRLSSAPGSPAKSSRPGSPKKKSKRKSRKQAGGDSEPVTPTADRDSVPPSPKKRSSRRSKRGGEDREDVLKSPRSRREHKSKRSSRKDKNSASGGATDSAVQPTVKVMPTSLTVEDVTKWQKRLSRFPDACLYPCDVSSKHAPLTDDEVYATLVAPVAAVQDATLYIIADSCHSGTFLNLRHVYNDLTTKFETDHNVPATQATVAGTIIALSSSMNVDPKTAVPRNYWTAVLGNMGRMTQALLPRIKQGNSWSALLKSVCKDTWTSELNACNSLTDTGRAHITVLESNSTAAVTPSSAAFYKAFRVGVNLPQSALPVYTGQQKRASPKAEAVQHAQSVVLCAYKTKFPKYNFRVDAKHPVEPLKAARVLVVKTVTASSKENFTEISLKKARDYNSAAVIGGLVWVPFTEAVSAEDFKRASRLETLRSSQEAAVPLRSLRLAKLRAKRSSRGLAF